MFNRDKPNYTDFLRRSSLILLVLLIFVLSTADDMAAHSPHDDLFDIALSPTYDQDQTLYIIVRGNLLKSTDGGRRWRRIVNGLDNDYRLSSLVISAQTNKILFLSTLGDGIYKSPDEGTSWFKVNQGLDTLNVDRLAISPASSDVVLAAGAEQGLYRTEDGGTTWHQVMPNNKITALTFFPDQRDFVIAGDNQDTIFLSTDRGQTWDRCCSIIGAGDGITAFAISPNYSSDSTFFVGTKERGVLKTVDQGLTFSEVNDGLSDQSIVSLAIISDGKHDFTILATTWHEAVFRTDDQGASWQKYNKGLTKHPQAVKFRRPNFSTLRVSSQDNVVYLGCFDGLFKSHDRGHTWHELETLSSSIVIGFALSPTYQHDSTVLISTYLGGAYLTQDHGQTWSDVNKDLVGFWLFQKGVARLHDVAFSPDYQTDKTLFLVVGNGLVKSTDNGLSWHNIPLTSDYWGFRRLIKTIRSRSPKWLSDSTKGMADPNADYTPYVIAISPNFKVDQTLFLGSKKGAIFTSNEGGENLSAVANLNHSISSLVISPDFSTDQTLYAVAQGEGIFKTEDAGQTWQATNNGLIMLEKRIELAISPYYSQDHTVFAGTADGLFKTEDSGRSWQKLSDTVYGESGTIVAVAISPNYKSDQTLLISVKGTGLFKSIDGGDSFFRIGETLIDNNHLLANMNHFPPTATRIRFSPAYTLDNTIYGTSGIAFFRSTDAGQTWETVAIPIYEENSNSIATLQSLFKVFPFLGILVGLGIILAGGLLLRRFFNKRE